MHIKFDDKENENETSDQGESFADMQVPKDTSESFEYSDFEDSPEAVPTSEAQDKEVSDEAEDGSQQANQFKNTFKYKSSHHEDLIIGNKESPEEQDHISDKKSL